MNNWFYVIMIERLLMNTKRFALNRFIRKYDMQSIWMRWLDCYAGNRKTIGYNAADFL